MSKAMLNDDELEQNWAPEGVDLSDDEDVVSVGSDDELEDDDDMDAPSTKRTRGDEDESDDEEDDGSDDDKPATKKQKNNEKVSTKKEKPTKGLHKVPVAEHFKIVNDFYIKQRGGQMTTLELAEGLAESHFVAPAGLGKHTLPNLSLYMRHLRPAWKVDFKGKGKKYDKSTYFLVICSSALRAVEVLKHFGSFKCKVAKLFAKHMKVEDQEIQLAKTFNPISVGTPGRIKKLLEINALSLEHTTHVFIDMEKDKKAMTLLELKDTAKEMMELLQFHLLPQLKADKLKLVLY
ncbi:hypothetical protein Poli38472_009424 [Pythium oligandrum]|uniref:Uncharacterized protein n=1 Tax=Pythium oligandrum TaxID=41045 RepID=A0A8K1CKQ2_PYTOL|nr:hypothetical protein Poli38472_009424 [Pythium oligandrum]|eukprot:TMW65257.1 hypothetical protein Poli38472_009424 [Pythium oligandrum]